MLRLIILCIGLSVFIAGCGAQQPKTNLSTERHNQKTAKLMQQAGAGNAAAQYALAYRYYYGLGVEENVGLAVSWMRLSKDNGYTLAKRALPALLAAEERGDQRIYLQRQARPRPAYIPPAPTNRHEYANLLQESNGTSDTGFNVQVANAGSRNAAEQLISDNGLTDATIQATRKNGKTQYKIVIGPYRSMREARVESRKLPSAVKKLRPSIEPIKISNQDSVVQRGYKKHVAKPKLKPQQQQTQQQQQPQQQQTQQQQQPQPQPNTDTAKSQPKDDKQAGVSIRNLLPPALRFSKDEVVQQRHLSMPAPKAKQEANRAQLPSISSTQPPVPDKDIKAYADSKPNAG